MKRFISSLYRSRFKISFILLLCLLPECVSKRANPPLSLRHKAQKAAEPEFRETTGVVDFDVIPTKGSNEQKPTALLLSNLFGLRLEPKVNSKANTPSTPSKTSDLSGNVKLGNEEQTGHPLPPPELTGQYKSSDIGEKESNTQLGKSTSDGPQTGVIETGQPKSSGTKSGVPVAAYRVNIPDNGEEGRSSRRSKRRSRRRRRKHKLGKRSVPGNPLKVWAEYSKPFDKFTSEDPQRGETEIEQPISMKSENGGTKQPLEIGYLVGIVEDGMGEGSFHISNRRSRRRRSPLGSGTEQLDEKGENSGIGETKKDVETSKESGQDGDESSNRVKRWGRRMRYRRPRRRYYYRRGKRNTARSDVGSDHEQGMRSDNVDSSKVNYSLSGLNKVLNEDVARITSRDHTKRDKREAKIDGKERNGIDLSNNTSVDENFEKFGDNYPRHTANADSLDIHGNGVAVSRSKATARELLRRVERQASSVATADNIEAPVKGLVVEKADADDETNREKGDLEDRSNADELESGDEEIKSLKIIDMAENVGLNQMNNRLHNIGKYPIKLPESKESLLTKKLKLSKDQLEKSIVDMKTDEATRDGKNFPAAFDADSGWDKEREREDSWYKDQLNKIRREHYLIQKYAPDISMAIHGSKGAASKEADNEKGEEADESLVGLGDDGDDDVKDVPVADNIAVPVPESKDDNAAVEETAIADEKAIDDDDDVADTMDRLEHKVDDVQSIIRSSGLPWKRRVVSREKRSVKHGRGLMLQSSEFTSQPLRKMNNQEPKIVYLDLSENEDGDILGVMRKILANKLDPGNPKPVNEMDSSLNSKPSFSQGRAFETKDAFKDRNNNYNVGQTHSTNPMLTAESITAWAGTAGLQRENAVKSMLSNLPFDSSLQRFISKHKPRDFPKSSGSKPQASTRPSRRFGQSGDESQLFEGLRGVAEINKAQNLIAENVKRMRGIEVLSQLNRIQAGLLQNENGKALDAATSHTIKRLKNILRDLRELHKNPSGPLDTDDVLENLKLSLTSGRSVGGFDLPNMHIESSKKGALHEILKAGPNGRVLQNIFLAKNGGKRYGYEAKASSDLNMLSQAVTHLTKKADMIEQKIESANKEKIFENILKNAMIPRELLQILKKDVLRNVKDLESMAYTTKDSKAFQSSPHSYPEDEQERKSLHRRCLEKLVRLLVGNYGNQRRRRSRSIRDVSGKNSNDRVKEHEEQAMPVVNLAIDPDEVEEYGMQKILQDLQEAFPEHPDEKAVEKDISISISKAIDSSNKTKEDPLLKLNAVVEMLMHPSRKRREATKTTEGKSTKQYPSRQTQYHAKQRRHHLPAHDKKFLSTQRKTKKRKMEEPVLNISKNHQPEPRYRFSEKISKKERPSPTQIVAPALTSMKPKSLDDSEMSQSWLYAYHPSLMLKRSTSKEQKQHGRKLKQKQQLGNKGQQEQLEPEQKQTEKEQKQLLKQKLQELEQQQQNLEQEEQQQEQEEQMEQDGQEQEAQQQKQLLERKVQEMMLQEQDLEREEGEGHDLDSDVDSKLDDILDEDDDIEG